MNRLILVAAGMCITGAESLDLRLGQGGADVDASVVSGTITIRYLIRGRG